MSSVSCRWDVLEVVLLIWMTVLHYLSLSREAVRTWSFIKTPSLNDISSDSRPICQKKIQNPAPKLKLIIHIDWRIIIQEKFWLDVLAENQLI